MDRKSILVLVVSFALILLWPKLMHELYPPPPASTNSVAMPTNQPAANQPAANLSTSALPPTTNASAAIPVMPSDAPEKLLVVTTEDAIYTFTSHGGGLKSVHLQKYPEVIDCSKSMPGEKRLASLNAKAPLPAFALLGDGSEKASFKLSRFGDTVTAERASSNGMVVIKEFQISSNNLIQVKVRMENRSREAIAIPNHEIVLGAATPMTVKDESITMGLHWFNGAKAQNIDGNWFANPSFLSCVGMGGSPRAEYQEGSSNVVWASVNNQFFALAVIPREPAPRIIGRPVALPPPSPEAIAAEPKAMLNPSGMQASFAYPALLLPGNQGMERQFTVYAGPKEYNAIARIGADMKNELDQIMGFGGFFGFFAKMLLLSMNGLHALGLSYGLSIIGITVIIKTLFWPLTAASTKSMKRMAALQPQLKAIADKYKDDPTKKNQKTMEFMKENKVSPLGGCLPMLLQIPVFFGFYKMLQSAIELRGASFLWACDLSQEDTIFHLAFLGNFPINPLPLIMGATMLWQARLTPMSPGMDPAQQKIMKYMPLMFIFILYRMSAGLTLYWTVQNLLTIAQMKLTNAKTEPVGTVTVIPPKRKK